MCRAAYLEEAGSPIAELLVKLGLLKLWSRIQRSLGSSETGCPKFKGNSNNYICWTPPKLVIWSSSWFNIALYYTYGEVTAPSSWNFWRRCDKMSSAQKQTWQHEGTHLWPQLGRQEGWVWHTPRLQSKTLSQTRQDWPFILALRWERQTDFCKFKVSLVCIVEF